MLDGLNVVMFVFKPPPECSLFATSSSPTPHSTSQPPQTFYRFLLQVLSQGRHLLTNSLSPDHSKDVRLQMKVLNER